MARKARAFDKLFTPIEGGYLYYPLRWSRGYFVSAAEYEHLRERIGWLFDGRLVATCVAFAVVAVVVQEIAAASYAVAGLSPDALVAITALPLISLLVWNLCALWRLVRGREPVAPPRSALEVDRDFARAMSWPMTAWGLVMFTGPVVVGLLALTFAPLVAIPWTLLFGLAWFQFARAARAKWQMRKKT